MRPYHVYHTNDDPDIKKIKKVQTVFPIQFFSLNRKNKNMRASYSLPFHPQVQSFMRGWLCRRKWKIIVQDYICSPHAESMRKRNQIVFNMVEAETEYVNTLRLERQAAHMVVRLSLQHRYLTMESSEITVWSGCKCNLALIEFNWIDLNQSNQQRERIKCNSDRGFGPSGVTVTHWDTEKIYAFSVLI